MGRGRRGVGRTILPCLVAALLVVGCGGDDQAPEPADEPDVSEEADEPDVNYRTEDPVLDDQIREAFLAMPGGAVEHRATDMISFAPPGTGEVERDPVYGPCVVVEIVTSPHVIEIYESVGSPVVTTPDGEGGALISGLTEHKSACLEAAQDALSPLPPPVGEPSPALPPA